MTATLLILVLIALVVVYARRKAQPDLARVALPVLGALALLLVGVRTLRSDRTAAIVHVSASYAEAQGYVLGEALADTIPKGSKVLVVRWDTPHEPYPALAEGELQGLLAAVKRADLELVQVGPDPFAPANENPDSVNSLGETGVPVDMVAEWMTTHPDIAAIISFCELHPHVLRKSPPNLPPLYFVAHSDLNRSLYQAVETGKAKAVVLLKPGSDWRTTPPSGSAHDVFAVRYLLLTKDNLTEILAIATAKKK